MTDWRFFHDKCGFYLRAHTKDRQHAFGQMASLMSQLDMAVVTAASSNMSSHSQLLHIYIYTWLSFCGITSDHSVISIPPPTKHNLHGNMLEMFQQYIHVSVYQPLDNFYLQFLVNMCLYIKLIPWHMQSNCIPNLRPGKLPFWFKVCCEAVHRRHAKHNAPASHSTATSTTRPCQV